MPDLAALRSFLSAQIGWSSERTDEVLVPVIKDMNRREKEGTQANITRFFEGSVGAGAFAPRVRGNATDDGPNGKKKGKSAAGKRLGAALTRLAEREGGRGGVNDDEQAGSDGDGVDEVQPKPKAKQKRKAPVSLANLDNEPEDDNDEDADDAAYQEPKNKKVKRTRKARGAA